MITILSFVNNIMTHFNDYFCRLTIGIRLLKKLGWKQGHGIGSRKKPDRKGSRS
jgi:hypothetical protein